MIKPLMALRNILKTEVLKEVKKEKEISITGISKTVSLTTEDQTEVQMENSEKVLHVQLLKSVKSLDSKILTSIHHKEISEKENLIDNLASLEMNLNFGREKKLLTVRPHLAPALHQVNPSLQLVQAKVQVHQVAQNLPVQKVVVNPQPQALALQEI